MSAYAAYGLGVITGFVSFYILWRACDKAARKTIIRQDADARMAAIRNKQAGVLAERRAAASSARCANQSQA